MTGFSQELRDQLRDDLMKTIGNGLRDKLMKSMRAAMMDALEDMVENQIFEAIDKLLDQFFAEEEMDCWMSFEAEGPVVLVGVGPGDCAASFDVELGWEFDSFIVIANDKGRDNAMEQIASIGNFVARLTAQTEKLATALATYEVKQAGALQ